jgi:hypothetical protein
MNNTDLVQNMWVLFHSHHQTQQNQAIWVIQTQTRGNQHQAGLFECTWRRKFPVSVTNHTPIPRHNTQQININTVWRSCYTYTQVSKSRNIKNNFNSSGLLEEYKRVQTWWYECNQKLYIIGNILNRSGSALQGAEVVRSIYWYSDQGIIVLVVEQTANHFICTDVEETYSLVCVWYIQTQLVSHYSNQQQRAP